MVFAISDPNSAKCKSDYGTLVQKKNRMLQQRNQCTGSGWGVFPPDWSWANSCFSNGTSCFRCICSRSPLTLKPRSPSALTMMAGGPVGQREGKSGQGMGTLLSSPHQGVEKTKTNRNVNWSFVRNAHSPVCNHHFLFSGIKFKKNVRPVETKRRNFA